MQVDINALIAKNAKRWAAMAIHPERLAEFDRVAKRLWTPATALKYQAIADQVQRLAGVQMDGVYIALVHERESSGNWDCSLAQGDPLSHRSIHVPAGRIPPPAQPPFTFNDCALDALVTLEHVGQWRDWSVPGALTFDERLNGLGYAMRGMPSPYVFSGTDQYVSGKFPRDHEFDVDMVDVQLGIAPLLARIARIDSDVAKRLGITIDHPAVALPAAQTVPADHQTTQWLQGALNTLGQREPYRSQMLARLKEVSGKLPLAVDGDYGRSTVAAVRGFQAAANILDDGKAGNTTRGKVEKALAALASPG